MRTFGFIAIIAGIILLELFLSLGLTIPGSGNLAKEPYRRQERFAAQMAYAKDKSPENEKIRREESRLVLRHVLLRRFAAAGALFAVFLVIDAVAVSRWRHHEKGQATA